MNIPRERLRTIPWVEATALMLSKLPVSKEKLWHWRNAVFQWLIPQHEIDSADVVIGFDTAAWIVGERAKRAGKMFVLDQSVGHPLARAKAVRDAGGDERIWPQAFVPRLPEVVAGEAREHSLADLVVVASLFSKRTLLENGVPEAKIRVLPYGVGDEFLHAGDARIRGKGQRAIAAGGDLLPATIDSPHVTRPFKLLYAGYLTKRKGVGLLMEAWKGMGKGDRGEGMAELRLVGGGERPQPLPRGVVCLGQTSRDVLLREMSEADVFVFPSLFEGFALVILEAMAAGLPVITTPNTAGPDLIEDGKDGLIVPSGDVGALRQAMESLLNDPEHVQAMGRAAHEKAKAYTWERYGERWKALLYELCS